jgi:hypothetical protein
MNKKFFLIKISYIYNFIVIIYAFICTTVTLSVPTNAYNKEDDFYDLFLIFIDADGYASFGALLLFGSLCVSIIILLIILFHHIFIR